MAAVAIEPALRQNDWAGAAIGAADGYAAELTGKPVPVPAITAGRAFTGIGAAGTGGSAGSTGPLSPLAALLLPVGVLACLVGALVYASRRRGKRPPRGPDAAQPQPGLPSLKELDAMAGHSLVETDDAVKTSEQELGFAIAGFGEGAAAPFSAALESAKGELTAAFKLRQLLDDDIPEDDATRRSMLTEICARCAKANGMLDEQSAAFDRLRDLESRAPEVLPDITARAEQHAARSMRAWWSSSTAGPVPSRKAPEVR